MKRIAIASDFSDAPWGRFPEDGDFCGEIFRKTVLLPALKESESVEVSLDGAEGFGSSFLDEGFAGLIVKEGLSKNDVKNRLSIVTSNTEFQIYVDSIWRYIEEASENSKPLQVA